MLSTKLADSFPHLRLYVDISVLLRLLRLGELEFQRMDRQYDYKNMWFESQDDRMLLIRGEATYIHERRPNVGELLSCSLLAQTIYSCQFCASQTESYALWRCTSQLNEIVCIETSYRSLFMSVSKELRKVLSLKQMKYSGMEPWAIGYTLAADVSTAVCQKSIAFEYENESTLLLPYTSSQHSTSGAVDQTGLPISLTIKLDPAKLIKGIIVAPDTEPFVLKTITALVQSYLPTCMVRNSSLTKVDIEHAS